MPDLTSRLLYLLRRYLVWFAMLLAVFSSYGTTRVALLDFSTDDNSYRSIEAAADFTSLVQIRLASEPGFEWVERSQIGLAKTEFALAEMRAVGGDSPVRRGRMLGANWLVTGHFSSDDRERATLSFQVIELEHADVIASETTLLPEIAGGGSRFEMKQAEFSVDALRRLLAEAQACETRAQDQARVAFLFFADTSQFSFGSDAPALGRELIQSLEQLVVTNQQIRLVRYPKAFQATEESEMVVDGIIDAAPDGWRQTADLYVWGRYATTNIFAPGRRETRLVVELSLWNGSGPPVLVTETIPAGVSGGLSAAQTSDLIKRLTDRISVAALRTSPPADSAAVRREIAASIVKTYVAMTSRGRDLAPRDRDKFAGAVHMLETACLFDPDNADARLLWITCRYGWWVDFNHDVKNQFWTKWRRDQAWKRHVSRFGMAPGNVRLPFPHLGQNAVASAYLRSLGDVLELFPQWQSAEDAARETEWRKQGVHTTLVSAEYHGFPKDVPHDLAFQWRRKLEAELEQRKQQATEYLQAHPNIATGIPAWTFERFGSVVSNQMKVLTNQTVTRTDSAAGSRAMVPTPVWMKDWGSFVKMFRLYPPNVLPLAVKPEIEVIQFPPRYEVQAIRQMVFRDGQVWILALDERSAPTSDARPDLAAERLDRVYRVWTLPASGTQPELLKLEGLPASVNSMLLQEDQLWLAGDSIVAVDLSNRAVRKFGMTEGQTLRGTEALAAVGNQVYAAGDQFDLMGFDPTLDRWTRLAPPVARGLYHGTGNPYLLTGGANWLGYLAGAALFYDVSRGTWANAQPLNGSDCLIADGERFWSGGKRGLFRFTPGTRTIESWKSPTFLQSPMIGLVGNGVFTSNAEIGSSQLEQAETAILDGLKKFESARSRANATQTNQHGPPDPFGLAARIPGEVAALADDRDFLWLGVNDYFGSYLLLLNKSNLCLVAGCTMRVRDRISSLAVSDEYVWVGTAYGDNTLLRMPKNTFQSVPVREWKSLGITPAERLRTVQGMSRQDQALYAFLAGDAAQVVQLLGDADPAKAGLQEMLLLAWSHDAAGVDAPDQCRAWFDRISVRYPDSPWARYAAAAIKANDAAHAVKRAHALALAGFDRNRDGQLDAAETRAMKQDPEFAKVQAGADEKQLQLDMEQIVARYDQDGDVRLNPAETASMCQTLAVLLKAKKEMPGVQMRSRVLEPLLSDRTPNAAELLKRYDADKNQVLDASELKALAVEIRKREKK